MFVAKVVLTIGVVHCGFEWHSQAESYDKWMQVTDGKSYIGMQLAKRCFHER